MQQESKTKVYLERLLSNGIITKVLLSAIKTVNTATEGIFMVEFGSYWLRLGLNQII